MDSVFIFTMVLLIYNLSGHETALQDITKVLRAWRTWIHKYKIQKKMIWIKHFPNTEGLSIFATDLLELPSTFPAKQHQMWNLLRSCKKQASTISPWLFTTLWQSFTILALIKFWNFLFCWSSLKRLTASLWWLQNSPYIFFILFAFSSENWE